MPEHSCERAGPDGPARSVSPRGGWSPPPSRGPQRIPRPEGAVLGEPHSWLSPPLLGLDEARAALVALRPPVLGSRPASAVLVALFERRGQTQVLLTRRSPDLAWHPSEVAFPGGRLEPGESPEDGALREASEEVGLDPGSVSLCGRLGPVDTRRAGTAMLPVVGLIDRPPSVAPNPGEVERVFDVALVELASPPVHRQELWPTQTEAGESTHAVHFFDLSGETVWGATARILVELLDVVFERDPRAAPGAGGGVR